MKYPALMVGIIVSLVAWGLFVWGMFGIVAILDRGTF